MTTGHKNSAERYGIQEILNELEALGLIRRNGEFQGEPVFEITDFGQRVSPDVLGDQVAKPLQ